MARLVGKFLKGIVGDVTLKQYRNEQHITRNSRLTKSRMSIYSLKSATTFGVASEFGKYVRICFDPMNNDRQDGTANPNLAGTLNVCLDRAKKKPGNDYEFNEASFNHLVGFEFNVNSPVSDYYLEQPIVELAGQDLRITLPELNIKKDLKFPKLATSCKLLVGLGTFDLINARYKDIEIEMVEIPNKPDIKTFPGQSFTLHVSPGCVCILAISLQYFQKTYAGEMGLNSKELNPVGIMRAFLSEGEPIEEGYWDAMNLVLVPDED